MEKGNLERGFGEFRPPMPSTPYNVRLNSGTANASVTTANIDR